MKVSYFETGHYRPPRPLPAGWPLPPVEYDRGAGANAYRGMVERLQLVERLGFDWISVAEHHYSHRRVTPAPSIVAAHLAAHSTRIKIAVLGPIVHSRRIPAATLPCSSTTTARALRSTRLAPLPIG